MIHVYVKSESLIISNPSSKNLITDYIRGFNASHSLSFFTPTLNIQVSTTQAHATIKQASVTPASNTQASMTQASMSQTQAPPVTPASNTQTSMTPAPNAPLPTIRGPIIPASTTQVHAMIPRNGKGQRVDPRVEALAWLVNDARKLKACYKYHLLVDCTWTSKSCPNAHLSAILNIHQLNALQVLARGIPCAKENTCPDWKCCFGHVCPYGERCTKGGKCRFPSHMHITDLKVINQQRPP